MNAPEFRKAVQFYVDLVREHGEAGAPQAGFTECLNNLVQGNAAMWYDATSAAGSLEAAGSPVRGKIGYAPAPVVETDSSGWLYAWSWGIQAASEKKDDAWKFISWASSKEYEQLVGQEIGWSDVPAGKRASTYENPDYLAEASAFAEPTRSAIESADPLNPGVQPRPAIGIQFVDIPEFPDLGTQVSQEVSSAIAGLDDRRRGAGARPAAGRRRGGALPVAGGGKLMSTTTEPRTGPAWDRSAAEKASLRRAGDWARRAPLLPALIFLIIVTQLPFVVTLVISFMNWNAYYPDERGFAGIDNFRRVLTDVNTRDSIITTIQLTVAVVLVSLVLGLLIALLLDRAFRGRGIVRTMMITPFLIVPVAAALVWKHALYNPEYGLFNGVLTWIFGGERAAAGLDLRHAAHRDRRVAGLAVDAVHDADHPGRAAEQAARRDRGRQHRRLLAAGRSSGT